MSMKGRPPVIRFERMTAWKRMYWNPSQKLMLGENGTSSVMPSIEADQVKSMVAPPGCTIGVKIGVR